MNRPALRAIRLRGVRVHNLKNVDLDIARQSLTVFCGVSGSGKTSLALDTLYAEGQRRYIESFSAYTRQFLQRLDKPDVDSVEGIPPAIAVLRGTTSRGNRSTVATATEIAEYLRLLFAKVAELNCYQCGTAVRTFEAGTAAETLRSAAESRRMMVGFRIEITSPSDGAGVLGQLQSQGFLRVVIGETIVNLGTADRNELMSKLADVKSLLAIVDRLKANDELSRITESLETCFHEGSGEAIALIEPNATLDESIVSLPIAQSLRTIDGMSWRMLEFSKIPRCSNCRIEYDAPHPSLFSFNHPAGACPVCEGFGELFELDEKKIVPERGKTLREGAIAPWRTPAYRHELDELLALASDFELPVDIPYRQLNKSHRELIRNGVTDRSFGGLNGFFAWLDRKKYKMHIRAFLSRWRSYRRCDACDGKRLKPEALAYRIAGHSIADVLALSITQAKLQFQASDFNERQQNISRELMEQINARLSFLQSVGLAYLTLDRTLRTLSGGEAQRVALTSTLSSNLVNTLYVLDEPTAGLHPSDVERLMVAVQSLRNRGNTVVAVEHNEAMIRGADHIVELGPGAGAAGGRIVFQGTPSQLVKQAESTTADFLAGRRGFSNTASNRRQAAGWLELRGASGNNLKEVTVKFPLGVLAIVTGVSGSGKSSLVQETLYGALCKLKRKKVDLVLPYRDVLGAGQIEDVMLIDQSPISRSPRSNPATYSKAFDPIRETFAETIAAKTHNYTIGHFSFNVEGGRCETCQGDGCLRIDMQFLADITMKCPECQGTRYRKEMLGIRYRDRNIAEVLAMSVGEANGFFRNQPKIQERLQRLIDVGLDYLSLGQPCSTLSTGEAQRLKLAGFLAATKSRRTLFILDEPTSGLHFADVVQLQDCFHSLLADGHSLLVIEHNLQIMKSADWIIDLGPGAASEGGRIVAEGTPEHIALCETSITGRVLRSVLVS